MMRCNAYVIQKPKQKLCYKRENKKWCTRTKFSSKKGSKHSTPNANEQKWLADLEFL